MSSIPAAKERPSGIDAAKEAVLAYATRLGNRSLYARQSVVILAELSRLEEQVATLTRERDEAREAAKPYFDLARTVTEPAPGSPPWWQESKDWTVVFSFAGASVTLGDLRKAATLSRQSKEGGDV